jgi:hypothetical protein
MRGMSSPGSHASPRQQAVVIPDPEAVASLVLMGFDEAEVKRVLQITNNDVSRASNILIDQRTYLS